MNNYPPLRGERLKTIILVITVTIIVFSSGFFFGINQRQEPLDNKLAVHSWMSGMTFNESIYHEMWLNYVGDARDDLSSDRTYFGISMNFWAQEINNTVSISIDIRYSTITWKGYAVVWEACIVSTGGNQDRVVYTDVSYIGISVYRQDYVYAYIIFMGYVDTTNGPLFVPKMVVTAWSG